MKKWLWAIGTPIFFILFILGALQVIKPKLEGWILSQIQPFSEKELPVIISAKEFHLDLLPPKAQIIGLNVKTKKDFLEDEINLDINSITAKLDILNMFAGRLSLSGVLVEGLQTKIDLDKLLPGNSKPEKIDWNPFFKALKKIPLHRIAFQHAKAKISSEQMNLKLDIIDLDVLAVNESSRLNLRLDLQDATAIWGDIASPLRLQTEASLSPQGLDFKEIRLLGLGSVLRAEASFSQIDKLFMAPNGQIQVNLKASLPQLSLILKKIKTIPNLIGNLQFEGQIGLKDGLPLNGGFKLFGQDLGLKNIFIGQIETTAKIKPNNLFIEELVITQPAGVAKLQNGLIQILKNSEQKLQVSSSFSLLTDSLDLHELLYRIGVGDLPLELFIGAKAECKSDIYPQFILSCDARVEGDELEVRTGEGIQNTIVQIPHIAAEGNVRIDSEKVIYEASLKEKDNIGRSSGVIRYDDGFEIDFSTPKLNTKNIRYLAGLSLDGDARINGKTSGNSDTAKFQMLIDADNFYLEKFWLGNVKTTLSYEKDLLSFSNINGIANESTYQGIVTVDLDRKLVDVAAKSDRLNLQDITKVIAKNIPLPFNITGTGIGEVRLQGPFQINHLSYQAKVQFAKVGVVGEYFDQLNVIAESKNGEFSFGESYALKGKDKISLRGAGHPNGEINFNVLGESISLESSDNISKIGSNISGKLKIEADIVGQLRKPEYRVRASADNIIVEDQELAKTETNFIVKNDSIEGEAHLVGNTLQGRFKVPLSEQNRDNDNFYLQLNAKDWRYTNLFTLIGAGSLISEYQSSLTGTLDLKSDQGGFWNSSGKGSIEKLFLKRGALSLENPKSISLIAKDGNFSLQNFILQGTDAQVTIESTNSTKEQLSGKISASANTRLFQIFFPFMDELSGPVNASIDLSGKFLKPELLGQADINGVFVKIKNFPHPFEKIHSKIEFSQSKILINDIVGELAGGQLNGRGQVDINGPHDLPTKISINFNNVNLNLPDRMRTTGYGQISWSGNWFPFLLSGEYNIREGLVDKEFTDTQSSNLIRQSSYLPKIILQKAFEPITFDIKVKIDNPLIVKNSMVDGSVTGQIFVKGTPQDPIILGTINSERGTKITFSDKIFEVNIANLKFNDPTEINPEIYATARTRINEYDINLLVQGTAKNPLIRTSSTPPLSESDIVSLLALGVTSSDLDKRLQKNDQEQSGQYKVGTALIQQFEPVKKLQKAAGIQVQYSSNFDSTRNVEVRKFTVSKQLTKKAKVSVGFPPDKQPNEYRLQYSLSPNVSAIGTYEQKNRAEDQIIQQKQNEIENVIGVDLEFRKEFK